MKDYLVKAIAHKKQVPSSVTGGLLVNSDFTIQAAGGFIIQPLPNTEEETIVYLNEK